MVGQEVTPAGTLATGDLGCVSKLENTVTGHTLCDPKRVAAIYKELGVATLDDLVKAAEQGRIHAVEGFGKKTEQRIREEAAKLQQRHAPG